MGFLFGDSPKDQMKLIDSQLDRSEKAYNDYLNMIKGMVEGTGYDFFGPKKTTSSGTSSSTTVQNMNQFTRPEVLPEYKKLEGMWKSILEGRLARPQALPPGTVERQVAGINQAYSGADAAARNAAARRGLSGEAALALQEPLQGDRAGKIADLIASVPLKERELQNEDIQLASAIAQAFGLGQRTTGSTTSTTTGRNSQTTTSPANIGEYLGYLGLLRPFERPILQPQPRQGLLGALAPLAALLV
jgi:hypothetical protein